MRILEICVDLDGGGIDRFLYNYCRQIKDIDFDFVVVDNGKIGIFENDLAELGYNIYRVPRQSSGLKRYYMTLKSIMTENRYDIVHVHYGYKSAIPLLCAKRCGVKVRIAHAHLAFENLGVIKQVFRFLLSILSKYYATDLAACGVDSAIWTWGHNVYKNNKVKIVNNAIDTKEFAFSEEIRSEVRENLGINDKTIVIGHVGRLCEQKNQIRLLDIFSKIHLSCQDSALLIVGRGELEEELRLKAEFLGISDCVYFLGVRDDVSRILNAFDIFVFPSLFEGLPFTIIETQSNGLYSLVSDTVTSWVKITDSVEFLSLDQDDEVWSAKALSLVGKRNQNAILQVRDSGYDIVVEAEKIREYYVNLVN